MIFGWDHHSSKTTPVPSQLRANQSAQQITHGKLSVGSADRSPVRKDDIQLVFHWSGQERGLDGSDGLPGVRERRFADTVAMTSLDIGESCVFEHAADDRAVANSFLEHWGRWSAPEISRLQAISLNKNCCKQKPANLSYRNDVGIGHAREDCH